MEEKRDFAKLQKWERKAAQNLLRDKLFDVDVAHQGSINLMGFIVRLSLAGFVLVPILTFAIMLYVGANNPIWLLIFCLEAILYFCWYLIFANLFNKACDKWFNARKVVIKYVCKQYNIDPDDNTFNDVIVRQASIFPVYEPTSHRMNTFGLFK